MPDAAPEDDAARAWLLIGRLWQDQQPRYDAMAAAEGLSAHQAYALTALDPDQPRSMSAAAQGWGCGAANATALADRLEARGLVSRQPTPGDRRRTSLTVTAHGRDVRRRLLHGFRQPPTELAALPPPARRQLAALLEQALAGPSASR